MAKSKRIKLKVAERKEIDKLNRLIAVAKHGVETALSLHYEARERLWNAIWEMYPEVKVSEGHYKNGVLTYTPKSKEDKP